MTILNDVAEVGYHVTKIKKGTFGEADKIVEEVAEFEDALKQGVNLMALLELADLIGAIEGYLVKHHKTISLDDLRRMAYVTGRAFRNGHRN